MGRWKKVWSARCVDVLTCRCHGLCNVGCSRCGISRLDWLYVYIICPSSEHRSLFLSSLSPPPPFLICILKRMSFGSQQLSTRASCFCALSCNARVPLAFQDPVRRDGGPRLHCFESDG